MIEFGLCVEKEGGAGDSYGGGDANGTYGYGSFPCGAATGAGSKYGNGSGQGPYMGSSLGSGDGSGDGVGFGTERGFGDGLTFTQQLHLNLRLRRQQQ